LVVAGSQKRDNESMLCVHSPKGPFSWEEGPANDKVASGHVFVLLFANNEVCKLEAPTSIRGRRITTFHRDPPDMSTHLKQLTMCSKRGMGPEKDSF